MSRVGTNARSVNRPNYSYRSAPPVCSRATLARPERTEQSRLPARPTYTAAVALGIALPGCLVRDLADLPQGRCSIAPSERGDSRLENFVAGLHRREPPERR